jgi:hypothetical protein
MVLDLCFDGNLLKLEHLAGVAVGEMDLSLKEVHDHSNEP